MKERYRYTLQLMSTPTRKEFALMEGTELLGYARSTQGLRNGEPVTWYRVEAADGTLAHSKLVEDPLEALVVVDSCQDVSGDEVYYAATMGDLWSECLMSMANGYIDSPELEVEPWLRDWSNQFYYNFDRKEFVKEQPCPTPA